MALDRRHGERRQFERPVPDAEQASGLTDLPPLSTGQPGFFAVPAVEARRTPEAGGPTPIPGSALARVVRTYLAARAALGLALLAAQLVALGLGAAVSPWVIGICALYAVQVAMPWWLSSMWSRVARVAPAPVRRPLWLLTIGVDILAFGLLHALAVGASFNYAALLVLPVLMSGVLATRTVALGTAAGVALLLLLVTFQAVSSLSDGAGPIAQSGLAGIGLFVIALVASELAGRMAREELSARGSRELARQQAQLNRLVIEEMADGVLVIDRHRRVRAANPAARQLLVAHGFAPLAPFVLQELESAQPLSDMVEEAVARADWPEAGRELQLSFANGHKRTLRMRVRFTRGSADMDGRMSGAGGRAEGGEGFCVVLLEDARTAQARLRQEKLAAMGRVSAGIAHEIRNPLAAIAQANQLLLEEPLLPTQRQLSQLVADNVRRLQRIVDDVLELAPNAASEGPSLTDGVAATRATVLDWAKTNQVSVGFSESEQARLRLDIPDVALPVKFESEHLRRVLINLLDNALRHSTDQNHALMLRLAVRDAETVVLSLANDGQAIAADVEPHLFEPFFSTRSRGSGLGLYICKELCERHGASIEYRARSPLDRYRNGFVVLLRRASGGEQAQPKSVLQPVTG